MTSSLARAPRASTPHPELPDVVPVSVGDLLASIQAIELAPETAAFIARYETVGDRDAFLWRWVDQGLRLTALPCVDPAWVEHVHVTKFLGVMFDVMLDDVADKRQDENLLRQLLRVPFAASRMDVAAIAPADRGYVQLTLDLWAAIERRTAVLPRFAELRDLWEFDYGQLLNCMRYALVISRDPRRMNPTEHDLYAPHNMHMMISGTLDVMASPDFDMQDIGALREVLWEAQMMGRIGNMVTTWPREIHDRDLTSGVFAFALAQDILSPEDLRDFDADEMVERIRSSGVESALLAEWSRHRARLNRHSERVHSVELSSFRAGLRSLLQTHLASRGLK